LSVARNARATFLTLHAAEPTFAAIGLTNKQARITAQTTLKDHAAIR